MRARAAPRPPTCRASTATGRRGFVGVNVRDEQDAAAAFVSAHGITYPSIFDPSGRVTLAFRNVPPSDVPSTIVIDATGKIAAIHLGADHRRPT